MRWLPHGYGGNRRSPEDVKRDGWIEQGLLAVNVEDHRLTWPERELVKQPGSAFRAMPSRPAARIAAGKQALRPAHRPAEVGMTIRGRKRKSGKRCPCGNLPPDVSAKKSTTPSRSETEGRS